MATFIHLGAFAKKKKLTFKLIYIEALILFFAGIATWVYGWIWVRPGNFGQAFYVLITGQWWCPVQPIDFIFLGASLLLAAVTLDFLTRQYGLNRNGLLVVLPWIITGQYRYLHELLWAFQYWVTMNIQMGYFSDLVPAPAALGGGADWPIALLTHLYALLFVVFTVMSIIIILQESLQTKRLQSGLQI